MKKQGEKAANICLPLKVYGGTIIDSGMDLVGPKGLPPDVVVQIEDAVRKSMGDANFLKLVDSMSAPMVNLNHKEFTAYMVQTDKIMKGCLDDLGMIKK